LADNGGSEPDTLKQWRQPVTIHYIGSCSLDDTQADTDRLIEINKFIEEIDHLNTSLLIAPAVFECQYEHALVAPELFGVVIIAGGGAAKVKEVLARGVFGDGS